MSEVSFASIFTIEEQHSPLIAPYGTLLKL